MPKHFSVVHFACEHCDFETSSKSSLNLIIKLHRKKCKKTGRTQFSTLGDELKHRFAKTLGPRAKVAQQPADISGKPQKGMAKLAIKPHHIPRGCCFPDCLNHIGEYGHNADPVMEYPARCCDECNYTKVIPGRLALASVRRK